MDVKLEINHSIPSEVNIKVIKIEGTEKENPDKWVRYLTSSDSFEVRIWVINFFNSDHLYLFYL